MAQLAHAKSGSTTLTGIGNPASHRQRGQKLRRIAKPSPQRHRKMTSQGSAHGRFQRAIHRRNVENAEMAAREMGGLSLADALSLCELLANADPARYERAALRWLEPVH